MSRPKIVTLCGSSKFCDIMAVCAWLIEKHEHAISFGLHFLPQWYCKGEIPDHLAEHEGVESDLDALHLKKIDISDEIFVVNWDHYIGASTWREIEYANRLHKKVRLFTDDPIGQRVKTILQGVGT